MKKIISFINLTILYIFSLFVATSPAFAQTIDICPGGNQFDPLCAFRVERINDVVRVAVIILFIIAVLVATVFLIWGGIKWIVSGGDKSAVEAARNTIVAAIVGLVVAFFAFFLISVVGRFFGIDIFTLEIPSI